MDPFNLELRAWDCCASAAVRWSPSSNRLARMSATDKCHGARQTLHCVSSRPAHVMRAVSTPACDLSLRLLLAALLRAATQGGPFYKSVAARKVANFSRPPRSETPEVSWASYAYSTESTEAYEQTAYICSKLPTGGPAGSMAEAMSPRGPYFPRGGHSSVKTEGPAPFSTYANRRVQMLDSGILRDPRGGGGK